MFLLQSGMLFHHSHFIVIKDVLFHHALRFEQRMDKRKIDFTESEKLNYLRGKLFAYDELALA